MCMICACVGYTALLMLILFAVSISSLQSRGFPRRIKLPATSQVPTFKSHRLVTSACILCTSPRTAASEI